MDMVTKEGVRVYVQEARQAGKAYRSNLHECRLCLKAPGVLHFLDTGDDYCLLCFTEQVVPNIGGSVDEQA